MPTFHYGTDQIEMTDDDVERYKDTAWHEPGTVTLELDGGGTVHLVTGPGIAIWIDARRGRRPVTRIRPH